MLRKLWITGLKSWPTVAEAKLSQCNISCLRVSFCFSSALAMFQHHSDFPVSVWRADQPACPHTCCHRLHDWSKHTNIKNTDTPENFFCWHYVVSLLCSSVHIFLFFIAGVESEEGLQDSGVLERRQTRIPGVCACVCYCLIIFLSYLINFFTAHYKTPLSSVGCSTPFYCSLIVNPSAPFPLTSAHR